MSQKAIEDAIYDFCVMVVEEECVLDKPPARDDTYERAMHEIGLSIRDRIRCAQRNRS